MEDDALLSQIIFTIQETQRAFQSLLYNRRATHGSDLQDILGVDVAIQALGTIVGILEEVESSGGRLNIVDWTLRAPVVSSISGNDISIAQALIWDMRNLEQRLIDLNRQLVTNGTISSLPGEGMSIRGMVEKYLLIISQMSTGQMMCVTTFWTDASILIS
jgi:hypothetical protein